MKTISRFSSSDKWASFNMTPVIDIVFLLIIFFLVVCQFIETEDFSVTVPDDCQFAMGDLERQGRLTTVTVMKTVEEKSEFVVGSEKITALSYTDIVEKIAELIDANLKDLPLKDRIVTLRIDKDICFDEAQYALAGIAASSATDVKLAALREKRSGSQ